MQILAGNVARQVEETLPLTEVLKAAEGRIYADLAIINQLSTQPAPGDAMIATPRDSPASPTAAFGMPNATDPDPFGILALEMAGLEIREAGTRLRPGSRHFDYSPSPTSPAFSKFSRQSVQASVTESNRGSYMSTRTETTKMSDAHTQTDLGQTPSTTPSHSRSEDGRDAAAGNQETPHKEPDEVDYTKIDLTPIRKISGSHSIESCTMTDSATSTDEQSRTDGSTLDDAATKASSIYEKEEMESQIGNDENDGDDDADDEDDESEDDEEPIIYEVASLQPTARTAMIASPIQVKGSLVTIPKRIPPPLPTRSLARASRASKSELGDVSHLASPLHSNFTTSPRQSYDAGCAGSEGREVPSILETPAVDEPVAATPSKEQGDEAIEVDKSPLSTKTSQEFHEAKEDLSPQPAAPGAFPSDDEVDALFPPNLVRASKTPSHSPMTMPSRNASGSSFDFNTFLAPLADQDQDPDQEQDRDRSSYVQQQLHHFDPRHIAAPGLYNRRFQYPDPPQQSCVADSFGTPIPVRDTPSLIATTPAASYPGTPSTEKKQTKKHQSKKESKAAQGLHKAQDKQRQKRQASQPTTPAPKKPPSTPAKKTVIMSGQTGKFRDDQILVICPGSHTTMAQLGCGELTPPAHRIPTRMFKDSDSDEWRPYHTYKRKKARTDNAPASGWATSTPNGLLLVARSSPESFKLKKSPIAEALPYNPEAEARMDLPTASTAGVAANAVVGDTAAAAIPDPPKIDPPKPAVEGGVDDDAAAATTTTGDNDGVLDITSIVTSGQTREFLAKKEKEKTTAGPGKGRKGKAQEAETARLTRLPNSKRTHNIFHYEEVTQEEPQQDPKPNGASKEINAPVDGNSSGNDKDVDMTDEPKADSAAAPVSADEAKPSEPHSQSAESKTDANGVEVKAEATPAPPAPESVAAVAPEIPEADTTVALNAQPVNKRVRRDIEVGLERFLFVNRDEVDRIVGTIYRTIQESVYEMYMRPACWDNIVIVGGGARLRGLRENIYQTLLARHLVSPSTATMFTSELPSNMATPTGTGSQTPTGSFTGAPHQLGPSGTTSSGVNPLLQAATTASSFGLPPGGPSTPGAPGSAAGDPNSTSGGHSYHFHSQTPTSIKLAPMPSYLTQWTKHGFEDAMFLGCLVAGRLAFTVHNLDMASLDAQRMMSLNRIEYKYVFSHRLSVFLTLPLALS
ncbi:hypothetical protein BN1723_003253 [Verticillium longisporum]|uniref:Uncharacterized protein n=1 Tax=Verticillium longisporum TaxID=100787 RepID=A0A0G4LTF1_VERLO|nr:hypothetical protein BN1723_003253 [Verticillium longisporum]